MDEASAIRAFGAWRRNGSPIGGKQYRTLLRLLFASEMAAALAVIFWPLKL